MLLLLICYIIALATMTDTKAVSSSVILISTGYLFNFVQLLHNILYFAASMTKAQAVSSSVMLTSTQGYIIIFVQLLIVINSRH